MHEVRAPKIRIAEAKATDAVHGSFSCASISGTDQQIAR